MRKIILSVVLMLLSVSLFSFPFEEFSFGDANNDGMVNIIDALEIARFAVGMKHNIVNYKAADVSGDGKKNVVDALLIAQYSVDLIKVFPIEKNAPILKEKVDKYRKIWKSSGIREYKMVYQSIGFTIIAAHPYEVTVKLPVTKGDKEILEIINKDTNKPAEENLKSLFRTVDELFDLMDIWISNHNIINRLEFDPVYGYPIDIMVNEHLLPVDGGFGFKIPSLNTIDKIKISNGNLKSLVKDPYSLIQKEAKIVDHHLLLAIKSGGGCKNHSYQLFAGSAFMESYPVQVNLYLQHDSQKDLCKALITDYVAFDLKPLADHYKKGYGKYDSIRMNIYDASASKLLFSKLYKPQEVDNK